MGTNCCSEARQNENEVPLVKQNNQKSALNTPKDLGGNSGVQLRMQSTVLQLNIEQTPNPNVSAPGAVPIKGTVAQSGAGTPSKSQLSAINRNPKTVQPATASRIDKKSIDPEEDLQVFSSALQHKTSGRGEQTSHAGKLQPLPEKVSQVRKNLMSL